MAAFVSCKKQNAPKPTLNSAAYKASQSINSTTTGARPESRTCEKTDGRVPVINGIVKIDTIGFNSPADSGLKIHRYRQNKFYGPRMSRPFLLY